MRDKISWKLESSSMKRDKETTHNFLINLLSKFCLSVRLERSKSITVPKSLSCSTLCTQVEYFQTSWAQLQLFCTGRGATVLRGANYRHLSWKKRAEHQQATAKACQWEP